MNKLIFKAIIPVILLTFVLSACAAPTPTEDPAIKITEIASTVIAQMTQNAALTPSATPTATATETPTPTLTPTATSENLDATSTPSGASASSAGLVPTASADNGVYVSDVTIPDGTIVKSGTYFTKIWKVRNTGQNTWKTNYRLSYVDGLKDYASGLYIHIPYTVRPGETVELSIKFYSPEAAGKYESYWRLINSDGEPFGQMLSLVFVSGQP